MLFYRTKEVTSWTRAREAFFSLGGVRTTIGQKIPKRKDEACIFCHLEKRENQAIHETKHWIIKPNDHLRENCQLDLIVAWHWKKGHLEDIFDVPLEAWKEIDALFSRIKELYHLPALNFTMQFGNADFNNPAGGHIHGVIQIPNENVIPNIAPKIGWEKKMLVSLATCAAFQIERDNQIERTFVITQTDNRKAIFSELMLDVSGALETIKVQNIPGGRIVYREGDRRYTNGKYPSPYMTIHAPNKISQMRAVLTPSHPDPKKTAAIFHETSEEMKRRELRRIK